MDPGWDGDGEIGNSQILSSFPALGEFGVTGCDLQEQPGVTQAGKAGAGSPLKLAFCNSRYLRNSTEVQQRRRS